jgi:hypothetical protein
VLDYEEDVGGSGGIDALILNPALDESEQSSSRSGRLNTGKSLGSHKNGDYDIPRIRLNRVAKREKKNNDPGNSTSTRVSRSLITT